jgi:hypothetical protein
VPFVAIPASENCGSKGNTLDCLLFSVLSMIVHLCRSVSNIIQCEAEVHVLQYVSYIYMVCIDITLQLCSFDEMGLWGLLLLIIVVMLCPWQINLQLMSF